MPADAQPGQGGKLSFVAAHAAGPCDVAYITPPGGEPHLVTAGADGRLVFRRAAAPAEEVAAVEPEPAAPGGPPPPALTCVAAAPAGDRVYAGDAANFVRAYAFPSGALLAVATRFALPVRALAMSPAGGSLAAGGDDDGVKLLDTDGHRVFRTLPAPPYTRALAFDPEGEYVASAAADGGLAVWSVKTGRAELSAKRRCPALDAGGAARGAPAWSPDGGALLAAPARADGVDVALVERLSWEPAGELAGGHAGSHVTHLAFSKNGLYLATAGADQAVVVWDVLERAPLSRRVQPGAAASLAWHPTANALALVTDDGELGVWDAPVPPALLGPAADADAAAGVRRAAPGGGAAAPGGLVDAEAGDDGGGGASGDDGDSSDGDDSDETDRDDSFLEDGSRGGGGADPGGARARRLARQARRAGARGAPPRRALAAPPRPQRAVQPGATAFPDGGAGGRRRYLAYTRLGALVLTAEADHNVVEALFHDASEGRRRPPLLTDYFGFELGALSERGALYASPPSPSAPATLVWQPFDCWAPGSEWSLGLPPGEAAAAVAAGGCFAAAACTSRALRLFSPAGLQTAVLTLPGPPVALAAEGPLLAAVWAGAAPADAGGGDQALRLAVYDVGAARALHEGPLPLSPGARLAWLGFTEEGVPAAFDTAGVLRLRTPDFGGAWVPVFASAAERRGAEAFWPFAASAAEMHAIVVAAGGEPAVPSGGARPVVSVLPLRVPLAGGGAAAAEGGDGAAASEAARKRGDEATAAEGEAVRSGLLIAHLAAEAAAAAADGRADAAAEAERRLGAAQLAADRAALRLLARLVASDKQARALELAAALHTQAALEGALRLAHHHRAGALADRIALVLDQRLALAEAEAAEAAAADAAGGYFYAAEGGRDSDAAEGATPAPARAPEPAAASPAAGGSAPARRPLAAAAQPAAAAPAAAAAAVGGKRKAAGAANPFARKKIEKKAQE